MSDRYSVPRYDAWCSHHIERHKGISAPMATCRLLCDDVAALRAQLCDGKSVTWRTGFSDFCLTCLEHETSHVNGRCVTMASRWTP